MKAWDEREKIFGHLRERPTILMLTYMSFTPPRLHAAALIASYTERHRFASFLLLSPSFQEAHFLPLLPSFLPSNPSCYSSTCFSLFVLSLSPSPLLSPPTGRSIADMPVRCYNPFRALLQRPPGNWRQSQDQHREHGTEGSQICVFVRLRMQSRREDYTERDGQRE